MIILLAVFTTLLTIFVIPIIIYGLFSKFWGLKEPEKKVEFFINVLIQKVGTSFGFVLLYYLGRESFNENWLIYSMVWILMFAITEIGQAYMPNYSKKEAVAGIISEAIYFPLAGLITSAIL
jgi:hypothetical protein